MDLCAYTVNLVHHDTKTAVHDLVYRLGIEVFKHGRRIGNVREHDGDDFPLTLDRASAGKDFVREMLRSVGLRLVVIHGLRLFGFAQIVAAFVAELSANTIGFAAF